MKKGKKVKPELPIEYRLLITPLYKEREKITVTFIGVRTMTEFSSFHYEILAEPVLRDTTLRIPIRGLHAPQLSLPGSGPAVFKHEFPGLAGTYTVIVSKLDKEEAEFTVNISEKRVEVVRRPQKTFIDIVTTEPEW